MSARFDDGAEAIQLPIPVLKDTFSREISPVKEFLIVIEQRIPGALISNFIGSLDTDHGVSISGGTMMISAEYKKLLVVDRSIDIPVWRGMRLHNVGGHILASEESYGSLESHAAAM